MRLDDKWPCHWVAAGDRPVQLRRVTREAALTGVTAPAKLNLGLVVTGRRSDGYHNLVSLMVPLRLIDTVRVELARTFTLSCDDPALAGDQNLVLRAARLFQAAVGERRAARITLSKRIPVAAGLGGGSSDAAATLIALDALWSTNAPDNLLLRLARELGADVPFALYTGAMIARGIGDVLMPVPMPDAWVVLITPRVEIPRKTAALYRALTAADYATGAPILHQIANLRADKPLDAALLGNTFLRPLELMAPAVGAARGQIAALGHTAFLTGSGPTLYVMCESESAATELAGQYPAFPNAHILIARVGRG